MDVLILVNVSNISFVLSLIIRREIEMLLPMEEYDLRVTVFDNNTSTEFNFVVSTRGFDHTI